MTPRLSPPTKRLVELFFPSKDVAEASRWLDEECGHHLPACQNLDEVGMERIRFAAIKLSQGNIPKLLEAIDQARVDWRDLLMAADFGYDVEAHQTWAQQVLEEP